MSSTVKHLYSGQVAGTKVGLGGNGPQTLRVLVALNTTAAVAYLQLFNLPVASVTVGTTVPHLSFGIPANGLLVLPLPENGWYLHGDEMTLAGTTTRTGSTGAAIDVNVGWGE